MRIKANLHRGPQNLQPSRCQVEKIVELPEPEFDRFLAGPQQELPFIAENREMMHEWNGVDHCLLVLGKDRRDGVLVQSGGRSHALYAAHLPEARAIVKAKLVPAANYIIFEATCVSTDGSRCVPFEDLEAAFDLTIREGNGLDEFLKEELRYRKEISSVEIHADHVAVTCNPVFCFSLDKTLSVVQELTTDRKAKVFDEAVASICELYEGEDLYTMLHESFGLTLREIRDCQYFTEDELSGICEILPQVLDSGVRVRDILQMDGLHSRASIGHKDSVFRIPLEALHEMADAVPEACSDVLDAWVEDIHVDEGTPELLLKGVAPKEIDRLHDLLEAQKQSRQTAGPVM